jgi:hypothetical protein
MGKAPKTDGFWAKLKRGNQLKPKDDDDEEEKPKSKSKKKSKKKSKSKNKKIKKSKTTVMDLTKEGLAKDGGLTEEVKEVDPTQSTQNNMRLDTNGARLELENDENIPDLENKGKWMFRYSDPILNKWDSFIILIAIYNCFTLSFNIGFDPNWASHPVYITFDVLLIL